MNRHRAGLLLLVPGLGLFAARGLMQALGADPAGVPGIGPATAAGGAFSLVGLLLLALVGRTPAVLLGTATALVGHFVLTRLAADVAPGFVYFGTALVLADRRPLILVPGLLAFVGVLARDVASVGHALVGGGAFLLALAALQRATKAPGEA